MEGVIVGMCGMPVSEKYRGIKSDGIMYRWLARYCGIPSGGTDVQYVFIMVQITASHPHKFLSFYANNDLHRMTKTCR